MRRRSAHGACRLAAADVMLRYDGTLEGFFSLVFYAYATRCMPQAIAPRALSQPALGQEVVDVETDRAHAERVRVGLARSAGARCFENVRDAFLSCEPGRERLLLAYIEYAMDNGYRVHSDLAHPAVAGVERLVRSVLCEREKAYQFTRFEELEGGVYFARINPKANVVPLVMDHFVERFSVQPFVLYDEVHRIAGVYDTRRSVLVETGEFDEPARTGRELGYQQLWKTFYDAVANEQRYNPDLRRSFMPQRLWKNITELRP